MLLKRLEKHGIIKRFPMKRGGRTGIRIAVFPRPFVDDEIERVFDVVDSNPELHTHGIYNVMQLEKGKTESRESILNALKNNNDLPPL